MSGGEVPVHVALHTSDVDQARAFCRRLYYDPLRIEPVGDPGRFDFSADVVELGPITVGEVGYGTDIRVAIGALETSYHVLVPLTGVLRSRHRGTLVVADPTRAVVYRPTGDIELDWPGTCRLLSVKVERGALERELDAALDQRVVSPLPLGASFDLVDGPGRTWVALVRLLLSELRGPDALASQPRMAARWRDMVVSGLALTVEHPYGDEPAGLQGPHRPRTVKRVLDALHAEPARPFTSHELATIAGVGVRVLQDAFRQHVGMAPMTYLRRLRLDGVHTELSRSDPATTTVSEVAYHWGFTHLSRFAGAYRARFGVPPSTTLRGRP
ncbi:AraC family transcriptional regulator [Actinoplanes sp. SE50]|uniref:AraC family transcriptional regulator n=1 Tax=unclassified Actinoplanes TaxID=2626549 RepID=UPI00023ECB68|nr:MULTISPECIES: AraC family transcriptional regulator [unclassified Actinoplanes]AEV85988.1 XylDLEGF operon transcriptional activator 3 [Actinoplanes sp. SE50/110]ATO84386.1 AraC family transcriptional regulator [Actinoplanes sp. SE50]SLM01796.1 AraC family transcriptional regulator [Actinoplanes sp. SE50/110]